MNNDERWNEKAREYRVLTALALPIYGATNYAYIKYVERRRTV